MNALKKMLVKRAVKKKIEGVVKSVNRMARDLDSSIKRLEKRVPVKVSIR